uniref:Putative secreted protein n=1 Tax=Ixodes ricinus TaxID=34613 RepID=A0A6B0UAN0_IXORI
MRCFTTSAGFMMLSCITVARHPAKPAGVKVSELPGSRTISTTCPPTLSSYLSLTQSNTASENSCFLRKVEPISLSCSALSPSIFH